jgi:hypothetical protein
MAKRHKFAIGTVIGSHKILGHVPRGEHESRLRYWVMRLCCGAEEMKSERSLIDKRNGSEVCWRCRPEKLRQRAQAEGAAKPAKPRPSRAKPREEPLAPGQLPPPPPGYISGWGTPLGRMGFRSSAADGRNKD